MSLAAAVHSTQSLPTATNPGAFSAHAASSTAVGASQFRGDANLKKTHPNSICVTYTPSSSIGELCQMAFTEQTMGDNNCSYGHSYLVNMRDSRIPSDGVIKECHTVSNPNEVCVPRGTVAIACSPDQLSVGLNVGGANFQLEPSYIAVPKSEINILSEQYASCYGPAPNNESKKYAYVKTSSHAALDEGIRQPPRLNMQQ